MTSDAYITGDYLAVHPTWHIEDSEWKAAQILKILIRNQLNPKTVTEVGSGAGAILASLQKELDADTSFEGYEVSPQAHALASPRENSGLKFFLSSYVDVTSQVPVDVLLLMDVVEHVEDYFAFLRSLSGRSKHVIIHIPLELSAQSILRQTPEKVRKSAGHLHFYTKSLFLSSLEEAGYRIIDCFYTGAATERPSSSFAMAIARWPRKLLFAISPDLASRILGGFSLLVLAAPTY